MSTQCALRDKQRRRESPSSAAPRPTPGRVTGFELSKFGTDQRYDLPADLSSCDCPDHVYREERPGGCRHMQALRQALVAVASSVTPVTPEPVEEEPIELGAPVAGRRAS
jgi:hypothetical protein